MAHNHGPITPYVCTHLSNLIVLPQQNGPRLLIQSIQLLCFNALLIPWNKCCKQQRKRIRKHIPPHIHFTYIYVNDWSKPTAARSMQPVCSKKYKTCDDRATMIYSIHVRSHQQYAYYILYEGAGATLMNTLIHVVVRRRRRCRSPP